MKIKFKQPYISISKFDDIEINDFSILTGKNGSGKTHLLNALKQGNVEIEGVDKSEIVYYNYNDFTIFTGSLEQNPKFKNRLNTWNNERQQFFKKIQNYKNKALQSGVKPREESDQIIHNFTQQPNFSFGDFFGKQKDFELFETLKKEENLLLAIHSNRQYFSPHFYQFILQYFNNKQNHIEVQRQLLSKEKEIFKKEKEIQKLKTDLIDLKSKNSNISQIDEFETFLNSGKIDELILKKERLLRGGWINRENIANLPEAMTLGLVEDNPKNTSYIRVSEKGKGFFKWLLLKED